MITGELDDLQRQVPACTTLAFADLATQMVLVTNSDTPLERHALNLLCAQASLLLEAPGQPQKTPARSAMTSTQDEIRCFLRSDSDPAEVLICVGTADLDIDRLRPLAYAFLTRQAARA